MKRILESLAARLGLIGLVFGYFWGQKLWWLIPMVAVLLVLGILIAVAEASVIGPFIYTLF